MNRPDPPTIILATLFVVMALLSFSSCSGIGEKYFETVHSEKVR